MALNPTCSPAAAPLCRRSALAALASTLWSSAPRDAGADVASEAAIKAAYLHKFLAFVEWPTTTFGSLGDPQVVAVIGADAVFDELRRIVDARPAAVRPIVVRRLTWTDAIDGVHVLHVGAAAWPPPLRPPLSRRPLLVVTDIAAGLPEGSSLNFVTVQRRVRFEASPAAAAQAGLRLSARLLAVAERVVA